MTTWTSRIGAALCGLGLVGACAEGDTLFAGMAANPQASSAPLRQAQMAGGAVTLVPPLGYCIDRRGLGQRFALLARCDVLSGQGAAAAPLSVITVSVSPAAEGASLPTPAATATALGLGGVQDAVTSQNSVTFRAEGPPPARALSANHWRGTALIGGQIIGVALYGRAGEPGIGSEGRAILSDLIAGTKAGG